MSYADTDQFRAWFEGNVGKRIDEYMQDTNDSTQDELLEQALNTAAFEMDRVFASIGYPLPLDLDEISDSVQRDRAEQWLIKRNIDLAVLELSVGVLRLPQAIVDHAKRGIESLEALRGDDKPHFGARGRYEYLVAEGIPGLSA